MHIQVGDTSKDRETVIDRLMQLYLYDLSDVENRALKVLLNQALPDELLKPGHSVPRSDLEC